MNSNLVYILPGLLLSLPVCPLTSWASHSEVIGDEIGVHHRPKELQAQVDAAFKSISTTSPTSWLMNGQQGFYNVMGVDEREVIRHLAKTSPNTDIYLIDAGASVGQWGREASKFIRENFADSGKHFHVISLTGGRELADPGVTTVGNVTEHRFDQFKLEDVLLELPKRGLKLEGKVDFITSQWTMRHLVDPMGTLHDLYELLNPRNGMMVSTGFRYGLNAGTGGEAQDSTRREWSGSGWKLLSQSSAHYFSRDSDTMRNPDDFILVRRDKRPLQLPVRYDSFQATGDAQVASGVLSRYQVTRELPAESEFTHWRRNDLSRTEPATQLSSGDFYGGSKSRRTFNWISSLGFFEDHSVPYLRSAIPIHGNGTTHGDGRIYPAHPHSRWIDPQGKEHSPLAHPGQAQFFAQREANREAHFQARLAEFERRHEQEKRGR